MTRTIKFRGLRTDGKGWVYGDLLQSDYSGCVIAIEHHIAPTMSEPGGDVDTTYHDVIDETVGQFTDMMDKDGNEAYGGDLISNNYGTDKEVVRKIVFQRGCWWAVHVSGKTRMDRWVRLFDIIQLNYTVIGNIHEKQPQT